jgi:cytochrome c biogenesis protein CcmG, thiol:disulfide interchange protein DsbE
MLFLFSRVKQDRGNLVVGNPAPDFRVAAVTGAQGTVALDDQRGHVVLLDFWGTFCEPCKKSFPKLQTLSSKYAASGVRVIGISEDEAEDKAKIPAFAETYGATFVLGWDADMAIAKRYRPDSMPTTFLIDRKGFVRFEHQGFHDGDEVEIEKELNELLAQ